jgi:hypothetical protein
MYAHSQLDEGGERHEGEDRGEGHMVGEVDIVAVAALVLDHTVAGPSHTEVSSMFQVFYERQQILSAQFLVVTIPHTNVKEHFLSLLKTWVRQKKL